MKTSPRLVIALTAFAMSAATVAAAAPYDTLTAAAKKSVPPCPQQRSPAVSAFNALPKAHIVATFLLGHGGTTFYTNTRGRIIGRSSQADGSQVAWSDHSRRGTDHQTRIAW